MNFLTSPDSAEAYVSAPRWTRVLWMSFGLAYLVIYPVSDLLGDASVVRKVLIAAALAASVGVVVLIAVWNMPWTPGTPRKVWVALACLTVMSVLFPLTISQDFAAMPLYLAIGFAMTVPVRLVPRFVLATAALQLVIALAVHAPGFTVAVLTLGTFMLGMMLAAFRRSRMLVVELHEARREVARLAATDERVRIARDLHDLLGHTLSLIVLKSEVAARVIDRDAAAGIREVKDIESVARQALTDVREAVSGYRQRDLITELDNARGVLAAAAIEATVTTTGGPLPDQLDGLFGWAVREGITNVVRHSRATACTIAVRRCEGVAALEITDNGPGTGAGAGHGNGLTGLGERVAAAGGRVTAGPAAEDSATTAASGWRLALTIPAGMPGRVRSAT